MLNLMKSIRGSLALGAAAALAGCAGGGGGEFGTGGRPLTDTQLAAWSARSEYPAQAQPSNELRAAAIVTRDKNTIKVYNFSDQPIRNAKLWVNKSYVTQVDIAPMGKAVIRTDRFFNGLGNSFASQKQEVSQVQLETADAFYELMGPATE